MRKVIAATALSVIATACGGGDPEAVMAGQPEAFQVDALWPQPLPSGSILGSVTGLAVDAQDHIWLVHRGVSSLTTRTEAGLELDPPGAETCCRAAPAVLELDAAGSLVGSWGGPGDGYAWPQTPGGLDVDATGNVFIAAAGAPPPADAHVLKFSRDGSFVMQIGTPGQTGGADSTTGLDRPADVAVDDATGELYVADTGNRRVVVFDAGTGAYKRHWGAYGEAPDPAATLADYDPAAEPARQFRHVSCVEIGPDDMVYVCDRTSNRLQVFQKDGTFVKEAVVPSEAPGGGAVWDVAFGDGIVVVADGHNHTVHVLDADTLEREVSVGAAGRWPGTFYAVGSVAVDSQGNLYTGEAAEGKRVQKFMRRQQ
jgi:DNA-binding beta-propeller fold protein YncE